MQTRNTMMRDPSPSARLGMTAALLLAALVSLNAAEVIPPKPAGYFNDYANVVSREDALRFNEQLAQFERDTSNQFLVVIFPSFPSESSVEDFAQRTFQEWKVWQDKRNNGVVLFVFVRDHKMWIQTGYGLEGALPDITCREIIANAIAPRFKTGDYTGGLSAGINAVIKATSGEYKGTGKTVAEQRTNSGKSGRGMLIFFIVLIIFLMATRSRRRRGYGYSSFGGPFIGGWSGGGGGSSGGSSGGGFSGFSGGGGFGGGSGGGGAGGSW